MVSIGLVSNVVKTKTSKDLNLCDGFTAYGSDANGRTFGTGLVESSYDLRSYLVKKFVYP